MTLRAHLLSALRAKHADLLARAATMRRFAYVASAHALMEQAYAVERRIWSLEAAA